MKRSLILCGVVGLTILIALAWRPTKVAAQASQAVTCTVPKAWGTFRGPLAANMYLFEDTAGTIRSFRLNGGTMAQPTFCATVERQ